MVFSRRSLILSPGFAMSVLVGAMVLIGGYWLPLGVRVYHGREILADSMVYSWEIVVLLWGSREPRSPVRE